MKKRKYTNKDLLKRFIPYYGNYLPVFILDMTAAAFTVVSELTLPLIIRAITDKATNDLASLTMSYIFKIGLLYFALKMVEIGARYYMQKQGHIMGAMIEKDMRRDVFGHIQTLPDEYFNNTKIGQLMARITTDLFDITEFSHHGPEEFFIGAIKLVISFIVLIRINVVLTLVLFLMIPLMFVFTTRTRKKLRKTHKEQRHHIGEINANIEDSLLGIKVIKSFANEDIEEEKFHEGNEEFLRLKTNFYSQLSIFHSVTRFLDGFMYLVVLVLGGILLIDNKLSPGDFVLFIMYVSSLLATVTRVVDFTETFEKGMTGIERFAELMDYKSNIVDKEDAIELKDVKGDISFNNVHFAYMDGSPDSRDHNLVLNDLNLDIKAGQKIAIVGPSGSGKTTLTNLIPRFYDVNEGSITVDGKDIRDVTLKSLRNNIGMVQQDVYLFSGTIKENISYGRPDASDEEIIRAADMAGASEFIRELPEGFDTYVGERGLKLSGGQKQRISIARVFLKNPPILILDEATSALDNKSERLVQKSLEELSHGRTTITIAHRLSTVINSDKILVLTENGIEESGSHQELLAQNGAYANLYKSIGNSSFSS